MKVRKVSIAVLFFASATMAIAQETKSDTVKNEKKIEGVILKGSTSKSSEASLLNEQKKSVEMKQAIGSQEMTKKGVTDAATAITKTAGVTKQEGVKAVFVRGLGDRYNSTSLNGLPLPAEDPLYKNISLEFFQSSIIKSINVNKAFSAGLYGDVAGANVDISSKDLDKSKLLSVSAGSGFNTSVIAQNNFAVSDGAYSYFGFLQNGRNSPIKNLTQYTFNSGFNTNNVSNPINTNFNILGGGKVNVGKSGNAISLFGVVSNTSDYTYRKGVVGVVTNTGDEQINMNMERSDYKTTQSLLGNAKYKHSKGSVSLNSLFIHNDSQFVGNYLGYNKDINDDIAKPESQQSLIIRQQNNNNYMWSNQLLADYKFSPKISANIGGFYSMICGSEPDRKTNAYSMIGGSYHLSNNSPGDNNRFFSKLNENDYGGKAEVNYTFNPKSELPVVLTLGGNYRKTDRTFKFTEFDYDKHGGLAVDPGNPDAFFNQQNLSAGLFSLITLRGDATKPLALIPMYYIAHREISAGYAQLVYPVNERLTVQVGLRGEQVKQNIIWDTNITSTVTDPTTKPSIIDKNYFLPSLNIKYNLNDRNVLRFAGSKTYTLPQFKEMANFYYQDINFGERGNPYLVASTVYNVDLKYDYYLSKKEIISIGGFYKHIQDPILRVIMNTPGLDFSYVNTKYAYVAGAEAELRKTLFSFEKGKHTSDLSFGLNVSYLYSEEDQTDVTTGVVSVSFTHPKGKMQGATPLLVNADLSFNTGGEDISLLSTLVVNYFSDRAYVIGTTGRENLMEKAVPTLDFINSFELKKDKITINFGARNILNPKFKYTQQATSNVTGETREIPISSYRKGATLLLGLNWQL